MSSPIWTPAALRSEAHAYSGKGWRLVEAQHLVSTQKLVDTADEQEALEDILETTKPPVPAGCRHLDYLLSTPFRYRPYPFGSRFRRAGITPGVWYGAERPETAVAEMAFYRLLFFAESPDTPFPDNAADYTAFSASLHVDRALDLTAGGLAADAALWTHPTDYEACQLLSETARAAGVGLIRYCSVRDPDGGMNVAVLTCAAFASPVPLDRQSWRIRIAVSGIQAMRDFPRLRLEFSPATFASDPRLAAMDWNRFRGH
ncbi:RES domain-containing protein [Martelella alba]|uniref:RES domain-containing protein n=1 Tax=Martelella alba TaxID=2590451 RepID=A0A506U5F8_9HYPH|nr:RES family NAD+ phosphorylase [Martelella alba]TPW29090.1 RES domain-containing protein [Martelella alba]